MEKVDDGREAAPSPKPEVKEPGRGKRGREAKSSGDAEVI